MSVGNYKFVLSKTGRLYVGFAHSDYHQEIAGIPHSDVKSAGYLLWGVDEVCLPNGKSIGYGIDVNGCEEEVISLLPDTEDELLEKLLTNAANGDFPRVSFGG
jgi:hypothetical protein